MLCPVYGHELIPLSCPPSQGVSFRSFKGLIILSPYRATPKEILERHGFDITALGKCRIHSIGVNIRKEYERYGGFHQGYLRLPKQPDPETSVSPPKTEAEQIRRLQHEVEYLKQEIEFLKKISSLKNIRKQVHCS